MEINSFDDAIGAYALENLTEGLMVILTNVPGDSTNSLFGARRPVNATEAKDAKYVVTWPQSDLPMPGPLSYPSLTYSLRTGGFDQLQSMPISQSLYLTYPGMTDGMTIPSGYQVVLHGGDEGVYTISSGVFVANAGLVPGAKVEALNVADDNTSAGMLSLTTVDADTVAYVVAYDAAKVRLTVKTRAL